MTNILNINNFMAVSELYFRLTDKSPLPEPSMELVELMEAINGDLVPDFSLDQYIIAQESKLALK